MPCVPGVSSIIELLQSNCVALFTATLQVNKTHRNRSIPVLNPPSIGEKKTICQPFIVPNKKKIRNVKQQIDRREYNTLTGYDKKRVVSFVINNFLQFLFLLFDIIIIYVLFCTKKGISLSLSYSRETLWILLFSVFFCLALSVHISAGLSIACHPLFDWINKY